MTSAGPEERDENIGRVLGQKYELIKLLGKGGMGAVYEGKNQIGKRVAVKLLLKPGSVFNHFLDFSDWLWQSTGKTHEFALEKLVDLLFEYLTTVRGLAGDEVRAALLADYRASGARGRPQCLAELLMGERIASPGVSGKPRSERQSRHVNQQAHRDEIQKAAAAA